MTKNKYMANLQVLSVSKTKTIFFVFVFTSLAVITPMVAHFFGGVAAGRMFLPMHFFVLGAGLLLGWRAGLAVGILTPLASFLLTGMPVAAVLPFIIIEIVAYGFFAGLLQKNFKNIWLSLAGAMALGRIFLWLGIMLLPTKLAATSYVASAMQNGWRGIVLQLLLVPAAVIFIQKFLRDERI